MSSIEVQHDSETGIASLILNRPDKRNALTREMLSHMLTHLMNLRDDQSIRLLRLESKGPVFCAGMDLAEMQQRAESSDAAAEYEQDSRVYCDLVTQLSSAPFPTIAVVPGAAVAGGVGLVLACDMVLCAEAAFFALPEPMRGITAAMVTPLLLGKVGLGPANSLLLSGERCSATRAKEIGLVHDVVAAEHLSKRVDELTYRILHGSPQALQLTKQHLYRCANEQLKEQLEQSLLVSAKARESSDAREGLAAFLEKRPPRWQPPSRDR